MREGDDNERGTTKDDSGGRRVRLTVLLFLVKVQSRHVVAPDVEHGLDGGVVHELHEGPWGWIGGEIWG